MSYKPNMMNVSESAKSLEKELQARKRSWFKLNPFSILFVGLFLLAMIVVPVLKGTAFADVLSIELGFTFIVTLCVALLGAWMWWRFFYRSDGAANLMFCLIIVVSGIWTTGLTGPQRAEAKDLFDQQFGRNIVIMKRKVISYFK
ncbi:MAG: hypothetical protein O7G85_11795 [Planctomycetota bacterium]|nr:hypothetical protein [Planctomycetota bacterium]